MSQILKSSRLFLFVFALWIQQFLWLIASLFAHYLPAKIAANIFNKFGIIACWLPCTSAVSLFLSAFYLPASFGSTFTVRGKMPEETWHWVIFRSRPFSPRIFILHLHDWKKVLQKYLYQDTNWLDHFSA